MALSTPSTPRNNLYTPQRLGRLGNTHTPNLLKSSKKSKEKNELATPKESAETHNNLSALTPKCFNNVTIETPVSIKNRVSRDKCDEVRNLTVAVRIRPMNARELSCIGATDIVRVNGNQLVVKANSNLTMSTDHIFQYDHVFWSCDELSNAYSSQEDVFKVIGKPLLESAFKGYNACLFAYGQTGSGKSFSMMGQNTCDAIDSDVNAGITPRFCEKLFKKINNLRNTCTATVEVSYFEIYNEKIHDLLAVNVTHNKVPLKVREHPVWGPYVVDLSIHTVQSYSELKQWLVEGNKSRATAATVMNDKSSRSHSIFTIEMSLSENSNEEGLCRRSKVSLIDLAGSERLGTGYNNEEKIRQGVSINKSLLTLGKVICALSENKKNIFVPYRESVLTWLLRESLGGNSLTSMLATISPANTQLDETLATLRYACQARSIVNRARINENPHDRLIRELKAEVERLRALRQDYERQSISGSSTISVVDSFENTEELEMLRQKLSDTEEKLLKARTDWEHRFMESKMRQREELAEAEKRKEELESHLRVMTNQSDAEIKLSPYKSNFLEELEGMLQDNVDEKIENKLSRADVISSMNQIYEIMSALRPTVDDVEENVKLLFARVNKLLQTFETALINSLNKSNTPKSVTFKL